MTIRIRRVRTVDELVATFDAIGRQFDPPFAAPDRRLDEPIARFDEDRAMQLLVEGQDGFVAGGVIAFRRRGGPGVTVRSIGLDPDLRGIGLGRRLLELVELEALALGCREISLGADDDARGFYEALGYRGKHTMRSKALPTPGRLTDRRIATGRATLGRDAELDAGLAYDPGARAGSSTMNATPGSSTR